MNKKFKHIGMAIAAAAAIVFGINVVMRPAEVALAEVRTGLAEVSFSEQGVVVADDTVRIFATVSGDLNGIYVREGQEVQAGDILVRVDDEPLQIRLSQVENGIRGIRAQLSNLYTEETRVQTELRAARDSLEGERQSIHAQAEEQEQNISSQNEIIDERLRIQNMLIEQNQSNVEIAEEDLSRAQTLFDSGVATRAELENAENALARARTALETGRRELEIIAAQALPGTRHFEGILSGINARISGIDQQLSQDMSASMAAYFNYLIAVEEANTAQILREIESSVVIAPVSGIITALPAQTTNFISPAAPVAEITVPGSRYIETYVPTEYINSVQIGDQVTIVLEQWAENIELTRRIAEIGDTAAVRFTFMGVEERTVTVRIAPDLPEGVRLDVGYSVDVTFYLYREPNRLIVPQTALFRHEEADAVWLVIDGALQAQRVETGVELDTDIVIARGLEEGDIIVSDADNADLREDLRVMV